MAHAKNVNISIDGMSNRYPPTMLFSPSKKSRLRPFYMHDDDYEWFSVVELNNNNMATLRGRINVTD